MIEIDGSEGEGGGQIVRTALSFSMLTGKPLKITNIRAGRPEPGLKSQHVHCITGLQQFCDIKVEGANLGSTELSFYPEKINGGYASIDIGTSGSISLLLQCLLPVALFADRKTVIEVTGGTCGKWQPSVEYLQHVLFPMIQRFAKKLTISIQKRGYFPKGGGKVIVEVLGKYKRNDFKTFEDFIKVLQDKIDPYNLEERGKLFAITGISHASTDLEAAKVAERQAEAATMLLSRIQRPNMEIEYSTTDSTGSIICLFAKFEKTILGVDILGEKGNQAEKIGETCAKELIKELEKIDTLDKHAQDQIIPYLALSSGSIKVSELTNHTKTNMTIANLFIPEKLKYGDETLKSK